jgi:hypothetical protein
MGQKWQELKIGNEKVKVKYEPIAGTTLSKRDIKVKRSIGNKFSFFFGTLFLLIGVIMLIRDIMLAVEGITYSAFSWTTFIILTMSNIVLFFANRSHKAKIEWYVDIINHMEREGNK